jgi:hypothetical protein
MADPIKWDSKIVLAKIETTYGTDPTPTGAANAILMKNVELRPMEGEDVPRNIDRPFGGAQEEIPVGLHCVLTGEVELQGSGSAGTAPAWGPLVRMCGAAQTIVAVTSVTYNPITSEPESGTMYLWIGPTLHKMTGVRGTFQLSLDAQGIPVIKFTLTGLFVQPSTTTRATPVLTGFIAPSVATSVNTPTFTVGGAGMILRSFTFDKANDVQKRFLIGSDRIVLVDWDESVSAQVEAVGLATYNPFTLAVARTSQAIVLTHGTVAGKIATLNVPYAVQKRLSGFANAQNVQEWPLMFKALPSAGDDQWSLVLT